MTRTDDLVGAAVEVGHAIARREPYELMLTGYLASLFKIDAGAALNECPTAPGESWSATVAAAEPLTEARITHCMQVASRHPAVRAFRQVGVTEPIRISDLVRLKAFWGTEPYEAMHANENGRYPMGMAVELGPQRLIFVGLQRTSHDFTDDEMTELAGVQRVLVAALRFRREVDRLVAQLRVDGENPVREVVWSPVQGRTEGVQLTPREQEVLALAARGWTNRRIGRGLGITERTVRKHLSSSYAKVRADGRSAAVAWWERHLGSRGNW